MPVGNHDLPRSSPIGKPWNDVSNYFRPIRDLDVDYLPGCQIEIDIDLYIYRDDPENKPPFLTLRDTPGGFICLAVPFP